MERIRKLPFLSGCMASVLAGIISFAAGADSQTIYIRMSAMMLAFFIIGIYIRNTINKIISQNIIREKEKELEEMQRVKRMQEEKKAEALAKAANAINMTVGNTNQDGFTPLDFVQAIKTKAKE